MENDDYLSRDFVLLLWLEVQKTILMKNLTIDSEYNIDSRMIWDKGVALSYYLDEKWEEDATSLDGLG